ncbi:PREDICTED: protein Jumonji-like isoform X1 [Branchiostoma belcheri]|uniref:Protein Jumonji-like isoform X1 n=1 Tax=Branchiostoma belcheri TaxID=7741 RepID=A0A6P4Z913_BRABE|nr:PREDICTED: protein Jumonji-like isoform X1 [Branchiostoma belcheri]
MGDRPRRNVVQKSLDYNGGILWREERDLKRALYASLRETKVDLAGTSDEREEDLGYQTSCFGQNNKSLSSMTRTSCAGSPDENSVGSASDREEDESSPRKKMKVSAQRKFAQSCPSSPDTTPVKKAKTTSLLSNVKVKTEDFITFLCLRATPALPQELDVVRQGCLSSLPALEKVTADTLCVEPESPSTSSSVTTQSLSGGTSLADGIWPSGPHSDTSEASEGSTDSLSTDGGLQASTPPARGRQTNSSKSISASCVRMSAHSLPPGRVCQAQSTQTSSLPLDLIKSSTAPTLLNSTISTKKTPSPGKKRGPDGRYTSQLKVTCSKDKVNNTAKVLKNSDSVSNDKTSDDAKGKRNPKKVSASLQHENELVSVVKRVTRQQRDTRVHNSQVVEKAVRPSRLQKEIHEVPVVRNSTLRNSVQARKCVNQVYNAGAKPNAKNGEATKMSDSKACKLKTASTSQWHCKAKHSSHDDSGSSPVCETVTPPSHASSWDKNASCPEGRQSEEQEHSSASSGLNTSNDRRARKLRRCSISDTSRSSATQGAAKREDVVSSTSTMAPKIIDAPVFYPTTQEFQDPISYIESIREQAQPYGICKVVPPKTWRPECKLNDDMRFTTDIQYVHRFFNRWGPNVAKLACIRKHLQTQDIFLESAPLVGGCELDLAQFSTVMAQFGGLQQVIDKNKWNKVADTLRIPKAAQDRMAKLQDAYCKYLLSYDMLPNEEKERLHQEVTDEAKEMHQRWVKLHTDNTDSALEDSSVDEEEEDDMDFYNECMLRGKSMSLSAFYRIARNVVNTCFRKEPSTQEVEHEYWKLVDERLIHTAVHTAIVDTKTLGSGFPIHRQDSFAKHGWNLTTVPSNHHNILRHLGSMSGVTAPWLLVGMLFTTSCWSCDSHKLPSIEYLHTGADKIWYSIPQSEHVKFRKAMHSLVPDLCSEGLCWLEKDAAMVPPSALLAEGVSLCRVEQKSGQFLVTFSGSYVANICCGYSVAEAVYFATLQWLPVGQVAIQTLRQQCKETLFSIEKLLVLLGMSEVERGNAKILSWMLPEITQVRDTELELRTRLREEGLTAAGRYGWLEDGHGRRQGKKVPTDTQERQCEKCDYPCYLSMVVEEQENEVYCLQHALDYIKDKKSCRGLKFMYRYDEEQIQDLVNRIELVVTCPPDGQRVKTKAASKTPAATAAHSQH